MKATDIDLSNADKSLFYYKHNDNIIILPIKINNLEEIKIIN